MSILLKILELCVHLMDNGSAMKQASHELRLLIISRNLLFNENCKFGMLPVRPLLDSLLITWFEEYRVLHVIGKKFRMKFPCIND